MKLKLMMMAALGVLAISAQAQTEKGKKFINGSIGYSSTKDESIESSSSQYSRTTSYYILPSFGYFFGKNLAVGAGIGYTKNKYVASSFNFNANVLYNFAQTSEQSSIDVSPFVRYYVDVAEKFKFFGHLHTAIGFGESHQAISIVGSPNNSASVEGKFRSYEASLSPGFAFFPSKKWAVEFSFPLINYQKIAPKDNGTNPTSAVPTRESFSLATSSFNPSIGFNFHF